MARFILISPVYGAPPNSPPQKFGKGRIIVDSAANALAPTDIVWPWLCNQAGGPGAVLSPLDAAASTMSGLPISTGPTTTIYGAGLDAGV
jgi:hypothetical protein